MVDGVPWVGPTRRGGQGAKVPKCQGAKVPKCPGGEVPKGLWWGGRRGGSPAACLRLPDAECRDAECRVPFALAASPPRCLPDCPLSTGQNRPWRVRNGGSSLGTAPDAANLCPDLRQVRPDSLTFRPDLHRVRPEFPSTRPDLGSVRPWPRDVRAGVARVRPHPPSVRAGTTRLGPVPSQPVPRSRPATAPALGPESWPWVSWLDRRRLWSTTKPSSTSR
jgi:hypothetical protein